MRLPEVRIKQAILHPEEEVRLTALAYFSRPGSDDEAVMPLVIEAVATHGRAAAFCTLRDADRLPQTPATIDWLVAELGRTYNLEDVGEDNYRTAVALLLLGARPELLSAGMADLPNFPEELRDPFLERLEMASWDWETAWAALEQLANEVQEVGNYRTRDARRAGRIIESLARHPEHADAVLAIIRREYRGADRSLLEWLEPIVIELAGAMRLEAAITTLVERMGEDDWVISDAAQTALEWIGGDQVVQALAAHWADGTADYRSTAAEILGHIRTDLAAEKCLEFLAAEEDETVRAVLADAALDLFAAEALEPARQLVLGDADDLIPDQSDLRGHLVAVATIMEARFPEYEQWYADAVKTNWGWVNYPGPGRIREETYDDDDEDDDDLAEDEWDEEDDWYHNQDFDSELDDEDFLTRYPFGPDEDVGEKSPAPQPIRYDRAPVGRNDPCPCGSGKKFKKCCLHKQK